MFKKRLIPCLATIFVLQFALFSTASSMAQVPKLEEHQKSVVLFDIRLEKIWAASDSIGSSAEELNEIPMGDIFQGIKLTEVKRVFGSASLPKDIGSVMTLQPDSDVPLEFFVRIEFTKSSTADQLESNMNNGSDTIEVNGKTFFQDPTGPKNIVAHRSGETSFEVGTKNYCLQPKRSFHTKRLMEAFSKTPDDPIRLVIDLESRGDLIQEGVLQGKEMAPPAMHAFLDLADNANWLYVTANVSGENLLTLVAEGKDEDQAEELRSGLDAILGMAKMGAQMGVKEMANDVPKAADVVTQVLASLAASREGVEVHITIPKPEGLELAIKEAREHALATSAMMAEMNSFRQLALAAHNYESAYRKFPFAADEDAGQSPELSWRVRVLPFLEQTDLFDQMDLKKGPGEEPNKQFAAQMPKLFGSDGKNTTVAWIQSDVESFRDIRDGTSNTIMLIELPQGRPWMENKPLSIEEAVELVLSVKNAKLKVCYYDGSTKTISSEIDAQTLRNLFDPNDGNVIDWDELNR